MFFGPKKAQTREGRAGSLGLAEADHHIGQESRVPLYSTGSCCCVPYLGISHNGKEYKKRNVYMCKTESLRWRAEFGTTL